MAVTGATSSSAFSTPSARALFPQSLSRLPLHRSFVCIPLPPCCVRLICASLPARQQRPSFIFRATHADAKVFEGAFKDDREIQEIIENSFEAPEEMGKRVNERIKRKEKDILQAKTGSPVPMKVSFCDFDSTDSYIWMELYSSPSEKDIDIIGSVIRSWYLLGCLGGYNSLNLQLNRIPVNERLRYKEYVEDELLPVRFVNIGELEFQHNWGRFWVDLGTSDVLALDIFVNAFIAISSDYVGVKELTFGGKDLGQWNEELNSEEEGYRSFKI